MVTFLNKQMHDLNYSLDKKIKEVETASEKSKISEKVISTSLLVNSTSFNAFALNEISCAFNEHKEKNRMIKNKIFFIKLSCVLYFNRYEFNYSFYKFFNF